MSRAGADVLIVGAGIAGLTAAALLQARGVDVEVAEREAAIGAVGAGILLHPNALRALAAIGGDVGAGGARIARQLSFPSGGGEAADLSWEDVWGADDLPLAIHRHRLAEQLLAHLDPSTVLWGRAPTSLTQFAERVTVRFDADTVREYRIVLGGDGVGSSIRPHVDPGASTRYLGQTYWRLTVPATGAFDFEEWRVWRSGPHFFGGMPVGGGRAHVFLQAALADPPRVAAGDAHRSLIEMARSFDSPIPALAATVDPRETVHVGPALSVSASRWANGRVALLGDAAHAASPVLTQGGAMAIEDATVAVDELLRRGLEPDALAAYEQRRRPRIAHVERMSRLHLMLIEADLGGDGAARDRDRSGPVGWYRTLYRPLKAAA